MYIVRIFLFSLFSLGTATGWAQSAPTAQEIINKYLQAMGGKEKLQAINSLYQEGIAVLGNGTELSTRSWRVYDRVYRQEVVMPAGRVVIVVTPRQGWSAGPGTGGLFKPLTDLQFKSLRPEIDPGGPLVDYSAKGNKVELAGKDTVNGKVCFRLKVSFPSGGSAFYSLDARTGYILRASHLGGNILGTILPGNGPEGHPDGEVVTEYGDYEVIPGGYIFPHIITLSPYGARVRIGKIEVNGNVDADALSKPK
ncbi:MAG TPA: hypothetical protein VFE32_04740 [Puia sp.]|jgi:hypothetical protein|nr:hypothetical protein [Puia sp.]